jgi:cytoskeletal protein CcmA (bactofilin family)
VDYFSSGGLADRRFNGRFFIGRLFMADLAHLDVPTILGPDSNFKGELTFEKGMRVHGRFEGKITTTGRLHVAKEAKMQVEVEAAHIVIEGQVNGRLVASDRLEFKQSARYEGDLRASRMIVEEGAVFSGHVCVGPEVGKGQSSPPLSNISPVGVGLAAAGVGAVGAIPVAAVKPGNGTGAAAPLVPPMPSGLTR